MNISPQAKEITPFLVMDILEEAQKLAAEGREVIHLEVGEPDFDTPACVREAAQVAMESGRTHYTHSQGIPELREAICAHYLKTYGVTVEPEQVIVSAGSSAPLLISFGALLGAGDNLLMSDPYYACYPNFARFVSAIPRPVPTGREDGFQLDPDKVRNAMDERSRALLINSPNNPTGVVLDDAHMRALADLGLPIISDEIYHGLVYEGEQHTILEYTDQAIVINGFSKAWAMTGWRLGWAIFPKDFVRTAQKIHQNLMICAPSVAQWGGVAALNEAGEDTAHMKSVFARRRKVMINELKKQGFAVEVEPTGAFYVMVNMRDVSMDSYQLAFDILRATGVGVTPGIDFGPGAEGYIRFSYANSEANIIEGVRRVAEYVKSR